MATASLPATKGYNVEELYHKLGQAFWLYFYLHEATGVEWQDIGLPPPTFLMHAGKFPFTHRGVFVGYAIDGYFGTKKGIEYLNDTIARFILAFKAYRPERLAYRPELKKRSAHIAPNIYRLADISMALPSLYWANKKPLPQNNQRICDIDQVFLAIKYYTEYLIGQYGEGTPIPYEMIENWAFSTFEIGSDVKDRSTLRAKCRSIWRWYDERNWTIPKGRIFEMTRSERAKTNAKLKALRARKKVEEAIEALKFLGEKVSVRNVAKYAGVGTATAHKYIKEILREEK